MPMEEFQYDLKWLEDPAQIMGEVFCRIHRSFLARDRPYNQFRLMFWIMTLAFAENSNESLVQVLLSFMSLPSMANLEVPEAERFHLHKGKAPLKADLQNAAREACIGFATSPEARLPQRPGESAKDCNARRKNEFKRKLKENTEDFVAFLSQEWPEYNGEPPKLPKDAPFARYFDHERAAAAAHRIFVVCKQNTEFSAYIGCIRGILKSVKEKDFQHREVPSARLEQPSLDSSHQAIRFVDVVGAFERARQVRLPRQDFPIRLTQRLLDTRKQTVSAGLTELVDLLSSRAKSHQEQSYVEELRKSISSLQTQTPDVPSVKPIAKEEIMLELNSHLNACKLRFDSALQVVLRAVGRTQTADASHPTSANMVVTTYHWPRITLSVILEQINCHHRHRLPGTWLERIINLGQRLTLLQQARRLIHLFEQEGDFARELQDEVGRGWYSEKHPDTLLVEIEGCVQVRHLQEDIARLMKAPPRNRNTVLQLNMGEGKSSVILPIVAASIADGSRLSRVIVAKPQSRQTFEMLLASFGGLASRRIYHLPFFRGLKIGKDEVQVIWKIFDDCVRTQGVLLIQPEHILSLQLLAVESHANSTMEQKNTKALRPRTTTTETPDSDKPSVDVEQKLLDILHLCNLSSRDIVDESDENFSPKFELMYTMGKQRGLQFSPYRWFLIQEVIGLVTKIAPKVQQLAPRSLEIDDRYMHRVPRIRILVDEVALELCRRMAEHICRNGLVCF
ncbi:hypothetical protein JDV02_000649 [Purpureocillium takamizusanense]|uniref:ubiquitinyl hydrolase 1 n=1 Tax=Purpureocillium takamizusanense TaxID=2060973 RepID=A0A9Q8Q7R8_9HYPO|nr:uncharacterized protein JDV02_000649 [Purpureocillium takamizusanense]UNI13963.1 hypothetical protein JDV02_000649 [Purpureocillium takamizusanense]